MKKVLFIGLGHMGSALIKGVLSKKEHKIEVYGYDAIKEVQEKALANISALKAFNDLKEVESENIDFVVIGTRPMDVEPLCENLDKLNMDGKTVICMANAVTIDRVQNSFKNNKNVSVIRMMPNMNASIQKSVTALATKNASPEQLKFASKMFELCGIVELISEDKFGTLTAVSGCLPAYAFTFFKGLTDYAVEKGFNRDQAYRIAEIAVIGSIMNAANAKTDLRTMIDQICVPNGSTIEGQKVLDNDGFEDILKKCLAAAEKKASA
ncbi:pyrroline-5-carboxylate reductase family protein [Mesoplasma melaleucae]|uniref:Pyrroline-5-carboxylate reductase n=1 Tax=Mesoplasma melaleucae TaxID=81459 RepID=A0A2K8NY23_9MOLU|nr:pyrroline-5-carboxylate reductase dimerization domain-containing protein [Mesoplasma melaleucae]ATZ17651.1 pyrroline-5-carboxylate reductase [Mesoplasma melaleucae]